MLLCATIRYSSSDVASLLIQQGKQASYEPKHQIPSKVTFDIADKHFRWNISQAQGVYFTCPSGKEPIN